MGKIGHWPFIHLFLETKRMAYLFFKNLEVNHRARDYY